MCVVGWQITKMKNVGKCTGAHSAQKGPRANFKDKGSPSKLCFIKGFFRIFYCEFALKGKKVS